jgi:hypothetical protein
MSQTKMHSTNQSNAKPSVCCVHNEKGIGVSINYAEQKALEAPLMTKGTNCGETTQSL